MCWPVPVCWHVLCWHAFHATIILQELQAMMDPSSGLHWSPWFRIIAKHFLPTWWQDLQATLSTDKHVDTATIHRLDC